MKKQVYVVIDKYSSNVGVYTSAENVVYLLSDLFSDENIKFDNSKAIKYLNLNKNNQYKDLFDRKIFGTVEDYGISIYSVTVDE